MSSGLHPDAARMLASLHSDLRRAAGAKQRTWAAVQTSLERDETWMDDDPGAVDYPTSPRGRRRSIVGAAVAVAVFAVVSFGVGYELGADRLAVAMDDRLASSEAVHQRSTENPGRRAEVVASLPDGASTSVNPRAAVRRAEETPLLQAEFGLQRVVGAQRHDARAPELRVVRSSKRRTKSPKGDLEAEMGLLTRARAAFEREDGAGARDLVREHARRFPRGQMAPERRALAVLIDCGRDPSAKARRRAHRFLEHHAGSPYARRIRSNCRIDD